MVLDDLRAFEKAVRESLHNFMFELGKRKREWRCAVGNGGGGAFEKDFRESLHNFVFELRERERERA